MSYTKYCRTYSTALCQWVSICSLLPSQNLTAFVKYQVSDQVTWVCDCQCGTSCWPSSVFLVCHTNVSLVLCSSGTQLRLSHESHTQNRLASVDLGKETTIRPSLSEAWSIYTEVEITSICVIASSYLIDNCILNRPLQWQSFLISNSLLLPFQSHNSHSHFSLYPLIYRLTSNKHHSSSQFCLWVIITDGVGSRSSRWLLINHSSGVASPTQPCRVHHFVAKEDGTEAPPLSHNATEGGVAPHRYNSVLWVHLELLIAGYIMSWRGAVRKKNKRLNWKRNGRERQIQFLFS